MKTLVFSKSIYPKPFLPIIFIVIVFLVAIASHAEDSTPSLIYIGDEKFKKLIGNVTYNGSDCGNEDSKRSEDEWFKNVHSMKLDLNLEKYYRNIFKKLRGGPQVSQATTQSWAEYKKAKLTLDAGKCTFNVRYRLTGDLFDHSGLGNGALPHSIKVKIKDGRIGNITKFKLFVPETRSGRFELLNILINQRLGFIAPRTALVDVEIGGNIYTALFQEDIAKGLLENNRLHESIIIEGDEGYNSLTNPKIPNIKFLTNKHIKNIADNVLHAVGIVYVETNISAFKNKSIKIPKVTHEDPPLIVDFFPENSQSRFTTFHLLNFALKSSGGLTRDDHRMAFDIISREFFPIFYDGHYGESDQDELQPNFTFRDKQRNHVIKELKNINLGSLHAEATRLGASFDFHEVENVVSDAIDFLENTKSQNESRMYNGLEDNIDSILKISQKFVKEGNLQKLNISWQLDDLHLQNCSVYLGHIECEPEFTEDKINDVNLNFKAQTPETGIFVYGLNRRLGLLNYSEELFRSRLKVGKSGTQIEHTKNLEITVNPSLKRIVVQRKIKDSETAQVRIFGGTLENWDINIEDDVFLAYEQELGNRGSEYGLTGCVTFNDIEIIGLNLIIKDSNCEDAVHFVRVTGSAKRLSVSNSRQDGVDADYSRLTIEQLDIKRSGNDCFDVSLGEYVVVSANLKSCEDKGISAGEGAFVELTDVLVNDALIGLVSKDGAILEIDHGKVKNAKICIAAYRKKQEYAGGLIGITNAIDCQQTPAFKQTGSVIIEHSSHLSKWR